MNVYLREADVLGQVDDWLAELFAPANIDATLDVLARQAAQLEDPATSTRPKPPGARRRVRRPDQPLLREVARRERPRRDRPWIAETQAKKETARGRDPHRDDWAGSEEPR